VTDPIRPAPDEDSELPLAIGAVIAVALVCGAGWIYASMPNAAEQSEGQYNLVASTGSVGEKCDAAKRVRDAWLARRNETQYALWQSRAQIDCLEVDAYGAYMPADPALRAKIEADTARDEAAAINATETAANVAER
jgi:hypothetical protein